MSNTTKTRRAASIENGAKGGRPRITPAEKIAKAIVNGSQGRVPDADATEFAEHILELHQAPIDWPSPPANIAEVMERFPSLNMAGFGTLDGLRKRMTPSVIKELREELISAEEQIATARSWIRLNCTKRKTPNMSYWSYFLKHVIERAAGSYVSNGAAIAAFIMEGYEIKQKFGSGPNCYFNASINISSK